MKEDTISFEVQGAPVERPVEAAVLDVSILINSAVKGKSEVLSVFDICFAGLNQYARFDLFTCACGVSGCAGFFQPVRQSREDGKVKWDVFDRKTSELLEGDSFSFAAAEYDKAIRSLRKDIEQAEAMNCFPVLSLETDREGRSVGIKFSRSGVWAKRFHRSFDEVAQICARSIRPDAPVSILVSYEDGEAILTRIERVALMLCHIRDYDYPVPSDSLQGIRDAVGILQTFAKNRDVRWAYSAMIKKLWHGQLSRAKYNRLKFCIDADGQPTIQVPNYW